MSTEDGNRGGAPSILVLCYSQTGDTAKAAKAFVRPLEVAGAEVHWEHVQAVTKYPFPWKNVFRFFDVLPDCILGRAPQIEPPSFPPDARFELVILAYQVWFLSPSLPIQGFLKSEYAQVLAGAKVITISVSRNMWNCASETVKKLLRQLGAVHLDNVVVTHQGPAWATFVTTPRVLLTGKSDRFLGLFPPAGLGASELARLGGFGEAVAARLGDVALDKTQPLLSGRGSARVSRYVVPELLGWYLFQFWGRLIVLFGKLGHLMRTIGVLCFMVFLVCAVIIGVPFVLVATFLAYPLLHKPLSEYIRRLEQPSGREIWSDAG